MNIELKTLNTIFPTTIVIDKGNKKMLKELEKLNKKLGSFWTIKQIQC